VRLEMRGICQRFGATVVLDDVSIRVAGSYVLALVGEYGPRKSTSMKVLSGAVKANALNSVKPRDEQDWKYDIQS
jgi:ABC-type sugar transport system ATPase subunit